MIYFFIQQLILIEHRNKINDIERNIQLLHSYYDDHNDKRETMSSELLIYRDDPGRTKLIQNEIERQKTLQKTIMYKIDGMSEKRILLFGKMYNDLMDVDEKKQSQNEFVSELYSLTKDSLIQTQQNERVKALTSVIFDNVEPTGQNGSKHTVSVYRHKADDNQKDIPEAEPLLNDA